MHDHLSILTSTLHTTMDKTFLELEGIPMANGDVQLNPTPGYVVKTLLVSAAKNPKRRQGLKVFINMCSDQHLPEPREKNPEAIVAMAEQGLNWDFQVVVSEEKEDVDKAGRKCSVWDCIMHPWFLVQSIHNPMLNVLVIETCLELVEAKAGVDLSREYTLPKMLSKGELARPVLQGSEIAGSDDLTGGFDDLAKQIASQEELRADKQDITQEIRPVKPLIEEISSTMLDIPDSEDSPSLESTTPFTHRLVKTSLPNVAFKVIIQGPSEQTIQSTRLQLATEGNELYFENLSMTLPRKINKVDAFYVRDNQQLEVFCQE